MRRRAAAAWIAAALALAGSSAEARAARHPPARPDFTGLWTNNSLTQLERPDDFKALVASEAEARAYEAKHLGKPPELPDDAVGGAQAEWWDTDVGLARIRGQARTSWIVSPADGQLPFTAAARAANKARRARRKVDFDGPESRSRSERCLSDEAMGPPLVNGGYNDNYKFVQTPDALVMLAEYMDSVRVVRLTPGAVHPPPSQRFWMGDAIGHWEGATLVIETTNFQPEEVDAPGGDRNADMTVVERLTRQADGQVLYTFTVRAPAVFVQPWRGEMLLRPTKGPIYEYACHEGNYALPSMISAARQAESRTAAVARGPSGTDR